jgi:DNA-binding CsgD family transcriptional regulator
VKKYTSAEAAAKLGISRMTIYHYVRMKKIQPPPIPAGRTKIYWSDEDIERAKRARESFIERRGRRRKIVDARRIALLRNEGISWAAIARQFGVSPPTAQKALQAENT